MLSEVNQFKKDKHILFHLYVDSNDQNKPTDNIETDS